jgi:predicted MPP superfamily phosphohydrolase
MKRLKTFTKKQWKAIIVLSISFILSFASFIHGTETPRIQTVEIYLDKLHPTMDNFRIIQLTDLHIGPTAGKAFTRSVVAATNALKPDLVVITGDLADGRFSLFRDSIAPIKDLHANYGSYYVTGNHEYIR